MQKILIPTRSLSGGVIIHDVPDAEGVLFLSVATAAAAAAPIPTAVTAGTGARTRVPAKAVVIAVPAAIIIPVSPATDIITTIATVSVATAVVASVRTTLAFGSFELHGGVALASCVLLGPLEALVSLEAACVREVLELLLGIAIHVLRALLGAVDARRLGAVEERLGVGVVLVFAAKASVHAGGLVKQAAVVKTLAGELAASALEHAQSDFLRDIAALVAVNLILAHISLHIFQADFPFSLLPALHSHALSLLASDLVLLAFPLETLNVSAFIVTLIAIPATTPRVAGAVNSGSGATSSESVPALVEGIVLVVVVVVIAVIIPAGCLQVASRLFSAHTRTLQTSTVRHITERLLAFLLLLQSHLFADIIAHLQVLRGFSLSHEQPFGESRELVINCHFLQITPVRVYTLIQRNDEAAGVLPVGHARGDLPSLLICDGDLARRGVKHRHGWGWWATWSLCVFVLRRLERVDLGLYHLNNALLGGGIIPAQRKTKQAEKGEKY